MCGYEIKRATERFSGKGILDIKKQQNKKNNMGMISHSTAFSVYSLLLHYICDITVNRDKKIILFR